MKQEHAKLLTTGLAPAVRQDAPAEQHRFMSVDVVVDSGNCERPISTFGHAIVKRDIALRAISVLLDESSGRVE